MKVLIPNDQITEYESEDRFNWCNKGELLYYPEFNTSHRNYLIGINSDKGCTHFVVEEMNIDKDFFTELIIGRIENSFDAEVNDDLTYVLKVGFTMIFNLRELVGNFIESINRFDVGDILCILDGEIIKSDE